MQSIFTWAPLTILLVFVACGLLSVSIGLLALKYFSYQLRRNPTSMPVAAFLGTVATAWALALGFAAADVWSINSDASRSASAERSSLSRLEGMSAEDALNSTELHDAIKAYRVAVTQVEWTRQMNVKPAVEVERALQHMRVALLKLAESKVPYPIVSQLVQDFDELQDARNDRLALGNSSINNYKWYLVLCLTVITTIVLASTHADRPRAGIQAMLIYTFTAVICMWILALHVHPYAGAGRLDASVLKQRVSQEMHYEMMLKDKHLS
ncbi:hypothetical protein [Paenochrobactrum glaciei]|uniref:DUF4239 domain-containing protein n=1 Tax=Paenochrobactrum glaciei TaxID=486407 RepID=A0ABP3R1R6_9HYPH